ncbi:hypothetical protein [Sphingobacterium wenxiniae]|uniref:Uncharacterized protein n=1 Tax=Sphingobacterium wenxiniae TaxID=683125 RepID=A0A1I6SZA4_9SPHI|nr:hypothetical protein [Sphingobacterium wenxiniae]SFS82232.1 hypothetical protein SAMN05660206_105163 [Sphingobacterium wenxiniae]
MVVERVNDEIVIRLPKTVKFDEIQRIIDLMFYKEATAQSQAKQSDIDDIAKSANKGWWEKNRDKFIK